MNLPFGLLSMLLLWLYLHEQLERRRPRIDYLGAALLAVGVTALLLGILEGGVDFPWNSLPILSLLGLALVSLALFIWQEFRAPEPIVPPALFKRRIISVSIGGAVLLGTLIVVIPSYLPLYVQGVQGGTALIAGIALAPLSVLWPAGSYASGVLVLRLGYRVSALVGVAFSSVGLALLLPLGWLDMGKVTIAVLILVGTGLTGFGLGILSLTYLIAIQNSVPWNQRGVVTASNQFARTIGGAIGVSALGAILNAQLGSRLAASGLNLGAIADPTQPGQSLTINALLRPETRAALPANLLARLVGPLGGALHILFIMMLAIGVAALAAAWLLPGGPPKAEDTSEAAPTQSDALPISQTA